MDELVNGQLKSKVKKMKEDKSSAFELGKTVASVERQKEDNKKEAEFNLIQKMQLQELSMNIRKMTQELSALQQQAMSSSMAGMPLGAGGLPPTPPPPAGEITGLPPEMGAGGMPPEMGGGMPGMMPQQGAPPMM